MRLAKIIEVADKVYPDGLVGQAYKQIHAGKKVTVGDTLAEFIAREISETYDSKAGTTAQLEEAIKVMDNARQELEAVEDQLIIEAEKPYDELARSTWKESQGMTSRSTKGRKK